MISNRLKLYEGMYNDSFDCIDIRNFNIYLRVILFGAWHAQGLKTPGTTNFPLSQRPNIIVKKRHLVSNICFSLKSKLIPL
jgi:hypothetical protein